MTNEIKKVNQAICKLIALWQKYQAKLIYEQLKELAKNDN
jgi:hypothetical protein